MSRTNYALKRTSPDNVPSIPSAQWMIQLLDGKKLHGQLRDILPEARQRGITQAFDRIDKRWYPIDPVNNRVLRGPKH